MARRKMSLERRSRAAAISLAICVTVVLGLSCLLLLMIPNEPAAPEPFYRAIPDVDTSALAPAKVEGLLKEWNVRPCICGCMRTVASCRNHHTACTLSLNIADEGVAEARVPRDHH